MAFIVVVVVSLDLNVVYQLTSLLLGVESLQSCITHKWLVGVVSLIHVESWREAVVVLKSIHKNLVFISEVSRRRSP